jgi:hypothetical protein
VAGAGIGYGERSLGLLTAWGTGLAGSALGSHILGQEAENGDSHSSLDAHWGQHLGRGATRPHWHDSLGLLTACVGEGALLMERVKKDQSP